MSTFVQHTDVMAQTEVAGVRLWEKIDDARVELDLTWGEVATRAGVARGTFDNIRKGRLPRPLTRKRIEDALGWARGSIRDVLEGGEPRVAWAIDPRTASAAELAERLEQHRADLIAEHGEERGLELFAQDYAQSLGARTLGVQERESGNAVISQDDA
jgi:DNA-binding XRE family transcriptional regulator